MEYRCEDCCKNFSSKLSLTHHRDTAVYCLKLRGINHSKDEAICEHCSKKFSRKDILHTHLKTCKVLISEEREDCMSSLKNKISKHLELIRVHYPFLF